MSKNEKLIREMVKTAKLIEQQVNYATPLDSSARFKALRTIRLLAQEIIDKGEGY